MAPYQQSYYNPHAQHQLQHGGHPPSPHPLPEHKTHRLIINAIIILIIIVALTLYAQNSPFQKSKDKDSNFFSDTENCEGDECIKEITPNELCLDCDYNLTPPVPPEPTADVIEPDDVEENEPEPAQHTNTASQTCGDNVCDQSELVSGTCPADCSSPPVRGSATTLDGDCGNDYCDPQEQQSQSCPIDCKQ